MTSMSERLPKHLDDAQHAAVLALRFLNGRTLGEYVADEFLRSAVERQVEIVGEACRRAIADTPELRNSLPGAALAIGMRNRIAHGYDVIDHSVVFNAVTVDFPPLVSALRQEIDRLA